MREYLNELQMLIDVKQHQIDEMAKHLTVSNRYLIEIRLDEIDELMAEQARYR